MVVDRGHLLPPVNANHEMPSITITSAEEEQKWSVLEQGENMMAMAMLVFLMADLRILSATGLIRTKYEYLCIDNDRTLRCASQDFAGYTDNDESNGVTAAHIMAVLLIEITREAEAANEIARPGMARQRSVLFNEDATFDLGRGDIKAASAMPAVLHCYNNMVAKDIADDKHKISRTDFPMSTEEVPGELTLKRSDFDPDVVDLEGEKLFGGILQKQKERLERLELPPSLSVPNLNLPPMRPRLFRSKNISSNRLQGIVDLQHHLDSRDNEGNSGLHYNKREFIKLLENAVEKRDKSRVASLMRTFFKEESISRVLVDSKAEMVWLSDWHTSHECTYAISIDKEKKKVLLAFRGAYTKTDWKHAFDCADTATSNPIRDHYPNKKATIQLHKGFHRYLFRIRLDTETTKYDEIVTKLVHYCKIVGDGVTLNVTGHSLGAALATVFSFYASTEDPFIRNGAIETVTFGAPLIGGYSFADAVRHQESVGKLRIAKFRVIGDGVTSLPPTLFSMSKRGAKYFHSGMEVKLPSVRKGIFKLFGQPKPRVKYHDETTFLRSWLRQTREWYPFSIPIRVWKAVQTHTLVEHKHRLSLIDKKQDRESSLIARYTLEELYAMRAHLS